MEEYVFDFFGEIGRYSYSANYLKYLLSKGGKKPCRMRLSSYGGEVHEALLCSDAIRQHGNVTIEIVGKCASAATFMALAAKRIEIQDDAFFLVHNCSGWVDIWGMLTKEKIQEKITELENAKKSQEAIDLIISRKYLDRSPGKTMEDITNLMKENRWMTAEETKEWGFVDEIISTNEKKASISDLEIHRMMAAGLPAFPKQNPKALQDKEDGNRESGLVERLISQLRDAFSITPKENKSTNSHTTMKKRTETTHLLHLLDLDALEEKDGHVSLTIDQLQQIEQALQEGETNRTQNEELTRILDGIDPSVEQAENMEDKQKAMSTYLDRLAATPVVVKHKYEPGETDYSDVAKDPVNFEE